MKDNPLVGKTIVSMQIAADRQSLKFVLTDGELIVDVDADCCSYSWVEHIELPAGGFPATVASVSEIDMPEGAASTFHTDADVLAFYGCKIATDKGEIVIDRYSGVYGWQISVEPADYHVRRVDLQGLRLHEGQPYLLPRGGLSYSLLEIRVHFQKPKQLAVQFPAQPNTVEARRIHELRQPRTQLHRHNNVPVHRPVRRQIRQIGRAHV